MFLRKQPKLTSKLAEELVHGDVLLIEAEYATVISISVNPDTNETTILFDWIENSETGAGQMTVASNLHVMLHNHVK